MFTGTKHTRDSQQVDSQQVDSQPVDKKRKTDGVRITCGILYFNVDIGVFNEASDLFTEMTQNVIAANGVICMNDCSPKMLIFSEPLKFVYDKLENYFTRFGYNDFGDLFALPWLKMKLSVARQFYGEYKTTCRDVPKLLEAWDWLRSNKDSISLQDQITAMIRFIKYLMAENIFTGDIALINLCATCAMDDPALRGGKRRIANVYRHFYFAGEMPEKWYAAMSFYKDVKSVAGSDTTINNYKKCIARFLNGDVVSPRPYEADVAGVNQAPAEAAPAPAADEQDQVM